MIINRGITPEEIAKRYFERVNANKETDKEKVEVEPVNVRKIVLPDKVDGSFILRYDDFGKELIRKNNERFKGTRAEIPLEDGDEVENIYWIKRGGLTTAIYNDKQLQSYGFLPITPLQSELLLKDGKLPKPEKYWEDLGLILYDRNGANPQEAEALYESLLGNKDVLGLSEKDLEERLLVANAGVGKDNDMHHGVKPIVLPGLTEVYMCKVLKKTKEDYYRFEYGLEHGLPGVGELGKGKRTLYMPSDSDNIGLRVLYRYRSLDLDGRGGGLVYSYSDGQVNFARKGVA